MKLVDYKLKVFYEVATKLSFTKAANHLHITQPAVTKRIQELEQQLDVRLFKRVGNQIGLTEDGELVFLYVQRILHLYDKLSVELSAGRENGIMRIGASTTVAQTVMPRLLAIFKKSYPDIEIRFSQGNSDHIRQMVLAEGIDLGIIEGGDYHPSLSYSFFMKDEIVLVVSTNSKLAKLGSVSTKDLTAIPLVLRLAGSGTLDVVMKALNNGGIDIGALNLDIQLESTIAIKEYLNYTDSAAFLSIQSVRNELRDGRLKIIEVDGLSILRDFKFIQLHGNSTKMVELTKRFFQHQVGHASR
ncbi:LysR substrate-binding domain-containing protein [Sphingobacterium mizutaii]|uniref:LysR substrate-binding domain-containing protein n=1 Tax=Sphingobacterium mizutaii TaxID=1010 RepID=UPI001626203F|nr:LysR substrate-binding domain-containing protein [Sphingobacterium mizutaii]